MKQIKLILLFTDQEDAINEDDSLIRFFTSINDSDKNYKSDKKYVNCTINYDENNANDESYDNSTVNDENYVDSTVNDDDDENYVHDQNCVLNHILMNILNIVNIMRIKILVVKIMIIVIMVQIMLIIKNMLVILRMVMKKNMLIMPLVMKKMMILLIQL